MKAFIVACLLSAATLSDAANSRRLGSSLGATGGVRGQLQAGVEAAGPRGGPGYTASVGAGLGARLGGQGSLGLGDYGHGFHYGGGAAAQPGLHGLPWGGYYGASPYGVSPYGYAGYGAPSGFYGFNPYDQYGSYGSYGAYGPYSGYGGYGHFYPQGGYGAYGHHGGNGAYHGWGPSHFGTGTRAAVQKPFNGPDTGAAGTPSGASGAAPAAST
uniref:Gly-Tyr rich salivary protein n=1 Tax=Hyalomma rufipes TaxID=72862 RepID=E2J6Q4_HYARU